uniref:FXYD domain-containing ion transport regulator n=1 Tax=Fundulus heteroclitus TaxID=8078 RepID=A0A3Q2PNL2_FUNHE
NMYLFFFTSFSVLFSVFMETEANYEKLRIGGLVFACLLIAGGVGIVICKCSGHKKITYLAFQND